MVVFFFSGLGSFLRKGNRRFGRNSICNVLSFIRKLCEKSFSKSWLLAFISVCECSAISRERWSTIIFETRCSVIGSLMGASRASESIPNARNVSRIVHSHGTEEHDTRSVKRASRL
jgi:hypothetical protein